MAGAVPASRPGRLRILVYVSNAYDNDVTEIDGATDTVLSTIPVGHGPAGVDDDPATQTVYVSRPRLSELTVVDPVSLVGNVAGNGVSIVAPPRTRGGAATVPQPSRLKQELSRAGR